MATIRKRKDKYQALVRLSNHPTVSKTFTLKSDARTWARETEIQIQKGNFDTAYIPIKETLREVLERYLKEVTPKKKSAEVEAIKIKRLLREPIAARPFSSLKPLHFVEFRDERSQNVSGTTTLKDLALLSHAIEIATKDWGLPLNANPVRQITKPKQNKPRDKRLEDNEKDRLLRACSQRQNHWLSSVVLMAIETAMRRGELLGLEWAEIDLNRTAHLPVTKNGTGRTVPLSTTAVETLESLPRDITGKVFPISRTALRGLWNRACQRAEIEDLNFHDLRHETTSRFFEKGLNVMEVAAITGHKDVRMLQRYTHLRAEDLAKKLG